MARRDAGIAAGPLLSVDEMAILLGLNRSSVYRSLQRGDLPLPVVKINGRMRVPRRAVERLLEGFTAEDHQGSVKAGAAGEHSERSLDGPGGKVPDSHTGSGQPLAGLGEDRLFLSRAAHRCAPPPGGPRPGRCRCSAVPCAPWPTPGEPASGPR